MEFDKKFVCKVLEKGNVERDVLVKRYENYIWGIINKKIGGQSSLPDFLKRDLFQYIFLKLFENDSHALRSYLDDYQIPFKNYLSLFASSRITDFLRKESKTQKREVVILGDDGENLGHESEDENALGPSKYSEFVDFSRFLEQFQQRLTEKDQKIFRHMMDGHTSGEIAKELKMDVKNIYKAVFKIKTELRESLKGEQDEGE